MSARPKRQASEKASEKITSSEAAPASKKAKPAPKEVYDVLLEHISPFTYLKLYYSKPKRGKPEKKKAPVKPSGESAKEEAKSVANEPEAYEKLVFYKAKDSY